MALDERYVLSTEFQHVLRDKDDGLPLRNGTVEFYEDKSRLVAKDVYRLDGTYPNYSYVSLGSTLNVNSAGYISDQFYFFPFDGTVATTTGMVDLYFIIIKDSDGNIMDEREAWPNTTASATDTEVAENFIPNGQFKIHNDLAASGTFTAGEIRAQTTDIAPGGYIYEGPSTPTTEMFVTFERFGSYTQDPDKSPRYYAKFEKQGSSMSEGTAELRIIFDDVNKFASDTEEFTFQFSALSTLGSQIVDIKVRKFFGTGGSPSSSTETSIPGLTYPITLNNSWQPYTLSGFKFGDNTSKTIGTNDDDYVAIVIQFTPSISFEVCLTDLVLAEGDLATANFQNETDRDFIRDALGGGFPRPAYDGSDLYLPALLAPDGWIYDHSMIGKVFPCSYVFPQIGELNCDGVKYDPTEYSTDGIPYSRLFDVVGTSFGNGTSYSWIYAYATPSDHLIFTNNSAASVTAPTNGPSSPGFTFTRIHDGIAAPGYFVNTWLHSANEVFVITQQLITTNAVIKPSDSGGGTATGLTFTIPEQYDSFSSDFVPDANQIPNAKGAFIIGNFPATGATWSGGEYFEYDSIDTGVLKEYYVWVTVDTLGTNPSPVGRTEIRVDLLSTDTDADIALKFTIAMRASEEYDILTVAESSITAGDSWVFDSPIDNYYVWYKIDGAGTDPAVSGRIGVPVDIASGDTATQVAAKTLVAVNERYFAAPDLRGQFIRGLDLSGVNDPDTATRYNPYTNEFGSSIGSQQIYAIQGHWHDEGGTSQFAGGGLDNVDGVSTTFKTGRTGGAETRPINVAFNYIIKY